MTEELLQSIRELNRRNFEPAAPAPGALAPRPDTGVAALLEEIQRRLAGRVRARIDHAVVRFAERLESMAPEIEVSTAPPLDDPLQKTQEIDYQEGHRPERELMARPGADLGERFDRLEAQLKALRPVPPKDVARAVVRELRGDLDEIVGKLDRVTSQGDAGTDSEAVSRLDAMQESLEQARMGSSVGAIDREISQELTELRVLVEAALPDPGFPRQGNAALREELQTFARDMKTEIRSMSKEMANHFVSAQSRSDNVAKVVQESLDSLRMLVQSANDSSAGTGPDPEVLQRALVDLRDLEGLPDKISAMLNAADEIHQSKLSAALQGAAEDITGRLQSLLHEQLPADSPEEESVATDTSIAGWSAVSRALRRLIGR